MEEKFQETGTKWNKMSDVAVMTAPKIGYGLMILIDLAGDFTRYGGSLASISRNRGIPLPALACASKRLEEIGLIGSLPDNPDRLYLVKPPKNDNWITEIIATLKDSF